MALGRWVFRVGITTFPAGSGDTTYNYVEVAFTAALAAGGTALWSPPDRRCRHDLLHGLLMISTRYAVGTAMLAYGIAKVMPLQFPPPSTERLLSTCGESSPMGLLWTFMAASPAYTAFAGGLELLGGSLLLLNRTSLAGALLTTAVMANVVALNLCYDVAVKLYSLHLLAMSGLIVLPHVSRLWQALVGGATAAWSAPLWPPAAARRTIRMAQAVIVGTRSGTAAWYVREFLTAVDQRQPASPAAGAWRAVALIRNGRDRALLATDPSLWRRVSIAPWA